MRKPVFGVSDQAYTNRAVHSQKMARGLKFWIEEVEGLYYPCSKNKGADQLNKGADQLCGPAKLICVFVFAYAKSRFSHNNHMK